MTIDNRAAVDRAALVDSYLSYLGPLMNFVRRRLRFHEAQGDLPPGEIAVEDVVDTVFQEAIERHGERPGDVSPYRWLRRLARRVLEREVERARRRRREVSLFREIEPGPLAAVEDGATPLRLIDIIPNPSSPIPSEVVERAEFQRALARILGQLPEDWREPFLLRTVDGFPIRDIAELEGVSPGEIRRRIEQARQFLRARLAEEYEESEHPAPSEQLFTATERREPTVELHGRLRSRLQQPTQPEVAAS